MMSVADPVFRSEASQAYTTTRSQRMMGDSQWAGSLLNAQESQFMRGTGNIVSGHLDVWVEKGFGSSPLDPHMRLRPFSPTLQI
jgi:hypothetical protein